MEVQQGSFITSDFSNEETSAEFWERHKLAQENREMWKEVLMSTFEAIDPKEVDALLASARTRGIYKEQGTEFLKAEMKVAKINREEGAFEGKSDTTVASGFRNWIKADSNGLAEKVAVIHTDGEVYLRNLELV